MKHRLFFTLILAIALIGCEKEKEDPVVAKEAQLATAVELKLPTPGTVFAEPVTAHKFELPSEALQVWRHARSVKPALVLFSIHPLLDQLADEQKKDIAELIESGNADTFRQRASFYRIDPAILPTQTLSAAIENELFSELIWIIPTRVGVEELSPDILRQQLTEGGFLTEEEGAELFYSEGIARGKVRGLPFRAVHPDRLPDLTEPLILHFDTGYFKGLFKNEVATPLYDILHQTIMRVMQAEWKVYATTLSYSTSEATFALDVRFLITALGKIIEDPALLQQMPKGWKLHADAMYTGNMYMEEKAKNLIEEALVAAPDNPTIVYALSQVRFQQGRAKEAFALLDRAVQLDPGYGVAYEQLSLTGKENGQFDKALELQRKAAQLYPENPFLKIVEADLLLRLKHEDEAIKILNDLQKRPWSSNFHPNAVESLNRMAESAHNPQPAPQAEKKQEKQ